LLFEVILRVIEILKYKINYFLYSELIKYDIKYSSKNLGLGKIFFTSYEQAIYRIFFKIDILMFVIFENSKNLNFLIKN